MSKDHGYVSGWCNNVHKVANHEKCSGVGGLCGCPCHWDDRETL